MSQAAVVQAGRRWTDPAAALRAPPAVRRTPPSLPGPAGLPLVGVMPRMLLDPLAFSRSMYARYGGAYRFRAFGEWHVHLVGPDANELVLFDAAGTFSAREGWGALIGPVFPGALLIKDGPEHRAERRILGDAFRQARLDAYERIFARDIAAAAESWRGRRIAPYDEIRDLTFRIAASTFLGVPMDEEARMAIAALRRMIASLLAMVRAPLPSLVRMRGGAARARLDALLLREIRARRTRGGDDFLSSVAGLRDDDGVLLDERRICDGFAFLLSAAHDTLASSLTALIHRLAAHPDWLRLLHAELREAGVFDGADPVEAALPLFGLFYKETLRLHPPAPVVWRRAMRDCSFRGHHLPAGTMTGVNLLMAHRAPDIWPDPDRFDPWRHLPDRERARGRFAFVPFGGGVHKCLGMHFAQRQARRFLFELLRIGTPRPASERPVRWSHWPNSRPRGRCCLDFVPRCPGR